MDATTISTGKGHQLRLKQKSYTQCSEKINEAIRCITHLKGDAEAITIGLKLLSLSERCQGNAVALDEAYNQNA